MRSLLGEVEALRAQAYSHEDEEHERMLLEVGDHVPPSRGVQSLSEYGMIPFMIHTVINVLIRKVVSYCSGYHEKTIESPFIYVLIRSYCAW